MAQQILEGTWEEIVAHADELTGKHIKVIVEATVPETVEQPNVGPPNMGPPNEQMLGILRDIAERQEGTQYTSGEGTQELIRQARNGGMYGMEPLEE